MLDFEILKRCVILNWKKKNNIAQVKNFVLEYLRTSQLIQTKLILVKFCELHNHSLSQGSRKGSQLQVIIHQCLQIGMDTNTINLLWNHMI